MTRYVLIALLLVLPVAAAPEDPVNLLHETVDVCPHHRRPGLGDSRVRRQDRHRVGGGRGRRRRARRGNGLARRAPRCHRPRPGQQRGHPQRARRARHRGRTRPPQPWGRPVLQHPDAAAYRRPRHRGSAARHADVHARWQQAAGRQRGHPRTPLPIRPIRRRRIRRAASASSTSRRER